MRDEGVCRSQSDLAPWEALAMVALAPTLASVHVGLAAATVAVSRLDVVAGGAGVMAPPASLVPEVMANMAFVSLTMFAAAKTGLVVRFAEWGWRRSGLAA